MKSGSDRVMHARSRPRGATCCRSGWWISTTCVLLLLAGCSGRQSTLDPAGRDAERIADLFWWMVAGAAVIWLLVVGLAAYAIRVRRESHSPNAARLLIVGGGVVLPTVVLAALLIYGLAMLPELTSPAPAGSLKIAVDGEQWWWRVRYQLEGGEAVELANEIRLPVGEPVEFQLASDNVIHSFWIPPLGGKVDMIPGRVTRVVLWPTRTGVFRGVCAEYCRTSHALMQFPVVVMERDEFARWLAGHYHRAVLRRLGSCSDPYRRANFLFHRHAARGARRALRRRCSSASGAWPSSCSVA